MSDASDYHSIPDQSVSEVASHIPKPSGLKQPSGIPSLSSKISRICSSHDKKPDLPTSATPKKNVSEESEYELFTERFGLGSRSSKSPDPFRLFKYSPDRKSSSGVSSTSPDFFEATGRRSSSDHGGDLTLDTDSFMIGQRVYVGGVKPGRITFIGEVHFAPGCEWAGVVLDEAEGKNDGSVSGKRYFQCEPKKGIFSRLTRLTREPLHSEGPFSMDSSFRSMSSPLRTPSGNTSPTQSVTSTSKAAGSKLIPEVNDRVIVKSAAGSKVGVLRYKGEPHFASGWWCGVEFDEAIGKNDGSVSGQRYFKCAPNHGLFVPIAKVELSPMARKYYRQNSDESLLSNLTLGSLQSTTTSKLRMNATQKRLSTLNKTPTSTSSPKPSFSLQDILREKSNHIEKIMKERDIDREEMTAQTILFQKNIEQYKEKIVRLEKLYEEEKKKSEDLQFSLDEAEAQTEENEFKKSTEIILRKKLLQLEDQLKAINSINSHAAGDYVDTSQNEEFVKLQAQLDEQTKQLHITEGLKASLEKEVHNLHHQIAEMNVELDLKVSGDSAREAVLQDQISYFSQRVEQLETELDQKENDFETIKMEREKIESRRIEELMTIENQVKEKIVTMTSNENLLTQTIGQKEKEILQLKKDIENYTKNDTGSRDVIKSKENEIDKLRETLETLQAKVQQLQNELEKQSSDISLRDEEAIKLQKLICTEKATIESQNLQMEERVVELQLKNNEIVELKIEIDSLQNSIKESSGQTREFEDVLNRRVTELSESKAKLENDLIVKDNEVQSVKEQIEKLQRENEEAQKCLSGLNVEAEKNLNVIAVKNTTIEYLTRDLNELKERNQNNINELQAIKEHLEEQISLNHTSSEEQVQKIQLDFENERIKLSSSITELNAIIREKDARIDVMNKNSSLLTEKKEELEARLNEFEMKCSDLLTKLATVEKGDNEKAKQLEKLQNIYDDTLKKLQESEITNKKLLQDRSNVEVDNKDLNRKLGALEEKVTQLSEQKGRLQQEIETMKNSSLDTDGALKKTHDELSSSQSAFEIFQNQAKLSDFELRRRIDELENNRDLISQNCEKLKSEMDALQKQKIENENELNHELSTIKTSTDTERKNLETEIINLRCAFESEKAQLKRSKLEVEEAFDRSKNEFEANVKSLKENMEDMQKDLELSRASMKQSESRMGVSISELKTKESQLSIALGKERFATDNLKLQLEELEASKVIQRDEYEEKLFLERSKVANLEGQLTTQMENLKLASSGNEEKIKFLDDLQQKCYEYEKNINILNQQVQNEILMKVKHESSIKDLQKNLKEIEEEQVDLVNRKEEYKNKVARLQEEVTSLQQRRSSLDEKLCEEKKKTDLYQTESDVKIFDMQKKLNELHQTLSAKDFEKDEILKRLKLREDDISELHTSIKKQERALQEEIDNAREKVNAKDDELLKITHESNTKDILVADLKNNLENLKTCLHKVSLDKESSTDLMQKLNETITQRESDLNDIKIKMQQMETSMIDKEHQLKNIYSIKEKIECESKTRIDDLIEQINILEEVKHKENEEWSKRLTLVESQLSIYQNEAESSSASFKLNQKQSEEFLLKIKDLEISETELKISNQALRRQIEEVQSLSSIPKEEGSAGGSDLVEHIEFLNSIIADMHKKNLKLSKQVQILETAPSNLQQGHDLDLSFMDRKKIAPRIYCDICEEFDAHETEDCPTQCSEVDLDAPAPEKKDEDKKKRKQIIRKYCDICEIFDQHDTLYCPNSDETF